MFTENDIEWFDVNTRELRFRDMEEPLYKKMESFHEIEMTVILSSSSTKRACRLTS